MLEAGEETGLGGLRRCGGNGGVLDNRRCGCRLFGNHHRCRCRCRCRCSRLGDRFGTHRSGCGGGNLRRSGHLDRSRDGLDNRGCDYRGCDYGRLDHHGCGFGSRRRSLGKHNGSGNRLGALFNRRLGSGNRFGRGGSVGLDRQHRLLGSDGGSFLGLLAQPAEQGFLFPGLRRSLLVVVGTKHGSIASQRSDRAGSVPASFAAPGKDGVS
ncbi:hypothetical protein PCA10_02660 [Metapseudomonas resinovorans NBRC 106553]|uniref:Uncharacterized protein n=1 Tax=Metapseudomonas resinovorans NBRC 106553 TaxID=1245471 RepID=S6AL63_METRE|nr:hypothetical protein PCA10_02660 [Pseudomonas resinovorans NBRC 106553]